MKYYDRGYVKDGKLHRDHCTEEGMLDASLSYMEGERVAGEMHKTAAQQELAAAVEGIADPAVRAEAEAMLKRAAETKPQPTVEYEKNGVGVVQRGNVPFAMPLTEEIADAYRFRTTKTGLMVGMRPDPPMFAKFESGELKAFSIGGIRIRDTIVEAE